MFTEYKFMGSAKNGDQYNFTIHIDSSAEGVGKKGRDDESAKGSLVVERIVADSFQFMKGISKKNLHINILSLDTANNKVRYEIIEQPNHPIHELAYEIIDKKILNKEIDKIVSKKILPVDKSIVQSDEKSILERFSQPITKPKGLFGKMMLLLAHFFSIITVPLRALGRLWRGVTDQAEKQLDWDLKLLSEICGTPDKDGLTMYESLQYMSKMVDREREEVADPELQVRLRNAVKVTKEIKDIREKYSDKGAISIVEGIQKSISSIGDGEKILMPVGYSENEKFREMLLEITKGAKGNYKVTLISGSEETLTLFDREVSLETTGQSLRREITNVTKEELLAHISTFVELQTSSTCLSSKDSTVWREVFLKSLRFHQSKVEVGKITETYSKEIKPGRLEVALAYVKGERVDPEEGKRFELASRLQLFLDICKTNTAGLKDKTFWTMIRTTALQLASMIEKEKKLLGPATAQSQELGRIFKELRQVLDNLEIRLPELADITKANLPFISGEIQVKTHPKTPPLMMLNLEASPYPTSAKPLVPFNPADFTGTLKAWGNRTRELIDGGFQDIAAHEAKIMVRSIDPIIFEAFLKGEINRETGIELLSSFNTLGEAIGRSAFKNEQTTLQDISATSVLTILVENLTRKLDPNANTDASTKLAKKAVADLLQSRLPVFDKHWLQLIDDKFDLPPSNNLSEAVNPLMQTLINANQFTAMTLGLVPNTTNLPEGEFKFKTNYDGQVSIEGNQLWKGYSLTEYTTPLFLKAPKFAEDISKEITNRYLTETCPLGCIGDNCPNYAMVNFKEHRFHPLYMLHNFVDVFCEKMVKDKQLRRDEVTDLMYTQQTNQSANDIFSSKHQGLHGFAIADGFNENDYEIQSMNAFMTYLDHPHFFKHAELRWHFETKVFTHDIFKHFVDPEKINQYQPYLMSMLKKLRKEISVSYAGGDSETGAYLINVMDELKEVIQTSSLSEEQKRELLGISDINSHEILLKWSQELLNRKDEMLIPAQKMVFSLLINDYYKTYCRNNQDPLFKNNKELETLVSVIARLQGEDKGKEEVDPEISDRCQSLMACALPMIQERVSQEATKGEFVNKILLNLNVDIAQERLQWEGTEFPTFTGIDKEGDEYQFDISNGKLSLKERRMERLPKLIKKNLDIQNLFGSSLDDYWKISGAPQALDGDLITAYSSDKFPTMRIVIKTDPKNVHQPDVYVERSIDTGKPRKERVTYFRFNAQNQLSSGQPIIGDSDLPASVAMAIGNRTCWVDRQKERIYVFDLDGTKPYAVMQLKKKTIEGPLEGIIESDKVSIVDYHLIEEDIHLLSPKENDLEQLSSIENPQFIQVTGSKTHVESIHLPRYEMATSGASLSFKSSKEGIQTDVLPGYTLAPFGERPGVKDLAYGVSSLPATYDSYLLLRKDGEERVLLPMREFERQYNTLGDALPITETVFPNDFKKSLMYEFTVDQETNRLVAKTGDAYAYIAYVFLAHSDYESAAFYLEKARTSTGYGDNYQKIFDYISQWRDDSPNGVALQLRFELFREKVLDAMHLQKVQAGNLAEAEAIDFGRTARLTHIADLYEKNGSYIQKGEGGTVSLLNHEEEKIFQGLIQQFLLERGGEFIRTNEPTPLRAAEIPLQKYLAKKDVKLDRLGNRKAAVVLWSYIGSEKDRSPFIAKEPRWILQNFQDVFNQLLELDDKSHHYKQLSHQIRMLSEVIQGTNLSELDKESILLTQFYLLKFITARETDPDFFDDLREEIGPHEKLENLEGPRRKSSRVQAVELMDAFLKLFNDAALESVSLAEGIVNNAYMESHGASGEWKQEEINKIKGMKILIENAQKFIHKWKLEGRLGNFKDAFKNFISNETFGEKGAQSIKQLNKIFSFIEGAPIAQPKQVMIPAQPRRPSPVVTYQEKYGNLIAQYQPAMDKVSIASLEAEITRRPDPAAPVLITTDPIKIQTVIVQKSVDRLLSLFNVKAPSSLPLLNLQLFTDLQQSPEKTFVRIADKNLEDLNAYSVDRRAVSILKDDAINLRAELEKEAKELKTEEEALKHQLLQHVELFNTPSGILAMRRLLGKEIKPSLDTLIQIWRRGDITKPWNEHPFKQMGVSPLSEAALKKLDDDITKYLGIYTQHQHLNRMVSMSDEYLKTCGPLGTSTGSAQQARELFEGLQTKRYYSINAADNADFRNLLFIEYVQDIILREGQVTTMREMISDPNAVRQLRPGYGKTVVLLPLQAKEKATGKNLVCLLLPEELYETNCRDLDTTNRQLFGQEMFRLEFNLKSDRTVQGLEEIYLKLLRTIIEKGFIMSTKRTMLGLVNTYKLILSKLGELPAVGSEPDKAEMIGQLKVLNKILTLFYNKTDIIADEVDACLDVRKEVNFALGKLEAIDAVKGDVGAEIMELILKEPAGGALYDLKESLLTNTQAEAISPAKRLTLMQAVVKKYYDLHQAELAEVTKENLVKYMLDDPTSTQTETWVMHLKVSNNDLFKKLSTLKAYVDRGFGTTLGRIGNVNYGRDPISGIWTIPYKASNTASIGSEFDDDIEKISFTYQDYIQNGVSYKQVYQIIAKMHNKALIELRGFDKEKLVNILDTEAAREFESFIKRVDPDEKLGAGITLASINSPKSIKSLVSILNESPLARLFFCHTQVVNEMKQYSAQINSVSTDVAESAHFSGFTGTPWNLHTYHDKINAEINKGVDGMTWDLMLSRDIDIQTFTFDAKNPIESLLTNINLVGQFQAAIDTGAYLRGTTNKDFIDKALKKAEEQGVSVKAGIYFDEAGKIVKKMGSDGQPLPINFAASTDPMTNMTLYDQAHTVGADIKQGKKAKAIVTIGENTFIRDLFQAVWRLRQLHQDQRVSFAVSDKVKERILEGVNRELTPQDIYKFCLTNEAKREAEDNFRSEKEKIQGFAKRSLLPQIVSLIDHGADDQAIYKLANRFGTEDSGIFIKKRPKAEAYDEYARIRKMETPVEVFERLKVKEKAKCEKIAGVLQEIDQGVAATQFQAKGMAIENRQNRPEEWFLNEVDSSISTGSEVEQEAQAEVAMEMMVEAELEQQNQVITEVNIPIAQTGQAGSGNVIALESITINNALRDKYINSDEMRALSNGVDYFDNEIYASAVFERNLPIISRYKGLPQAMFYSNRKPVKQVLIAKRKVRQYSSLSSFMWNDQSKTNWLMVIPTIHEGHAGCRDFIQNADESTTAVEVAISAGKPLLMYKTGRDRTDELPFESDEDKAHFYRLYVQAKLFNGEIEYLTQEEQDALKLWLTEKGVKNFRTYFENNILAAKPRRFADAYKTSSLRKVFDDLAAPQPVAV